MHEYLTDFDEFCMYHGEIKPFLNEPTLNKEGKFNYLTPECAKLLHSYKDISKLMEPMGITDVFARLCIAAAKELEPVFGVSLPAALTVVVRQASEESE